LDLEGLARDLIQNKVPKEKILEELESLVGSKKKAKAIYFEILNSEKISDGFIQSICGYEGSGYTAEHTGLGCRGEGDFLIHHKIAQIIENKGTVVSPKDQDDGGVVKVGSDFVVVSVDGMHSRLSHFPFIAGFHAARAAVRDTLVMGSMPQALFRDIHLGNDGDVAKVFDYTAGISVLSELGEIPLIAGSTLRIGGDLVLGDRLTGCVGCVGVGKQLTPRKAVKPKDVIIMTEGSGGGTITTTALFNGYPEIVKETLNLKNILLAKKLLKTNLINNIHSMTDVTNGGIRGDLFEMANTGGVSIYLFEEPFLELINSPVLKMLQKLEIDPLGVSIDSLLFVMPPKYVGSLLQFLAKEGVSANIIGYSSVHNVKFKKDSKGLDKRENVVKVRMVRESSGAQNKIDYSKLRLENPDKIPKNLKIIDLVPKYREEPYTPIKKVTDVVPKNKKAIRLAIDDAMTKSKKKKEHLKNWLLSEGRI
jgi:hydrogenase expression/formation protein